MKSLMNLKKTIWKSFILVIFFFHCNFQSHELRFGSNLWPGYEPIYLAQEYNLLHKKNIHLVEFTSTSQVIRAFRNKVINSAGVTLDEVFYLKEAKLRPKIVMILDISDGADVLIAKPNIQSIANLKNKKIGVENTALGAFFLSRILEMANLSVSDVKIIPLEIQEQKNAFIQNKVDAVVTFRNFLENFPDGKIIFDSTRIPYEIVDVLVIDEDFIRSNRKLVKEFMNIWFQSQRMIQEQPEVNIQIMANREKIPAKIFKESMDFLKVPSIEENYQLLKNQNKAFLFSLSNMHKYLQTKEIVKMESESYDLIDSSLIEEIYRETIK